MIDIPAQQINPDYQAKRADVLARYDALDHVAKAKRARDIARELGLSEAQWVAASCGPIKSIPLTGTGQSVFRKIGKLGPVMALTRNDSCVHERHGEFLDIQAEGPMGLVLGPDIDLRVFFACWQDAFAVEEGGRKSLQFFDSEGVAVHKVYCTEHTNLSEYLELIQSHIQKPQWPEHKAISKKVRPDAPDDVEAFKAAWLALTDTHDFFPMLAKHNISRLGALSHAGEDLAQRVPNSTVDTMLQTASNIDLEIMCFVGNRGMIQIHTGPVKQIVTRGPWLNVLDPMFNLHLNMDDVASTWIVEKPTEDGWVTSLEVFDSDGELIVQFFGARKPGKPELPEWRDLMLSLCHAPLRA
ncbi:MAG: hemin-degrading factor [Burkholderiaceae bacterium]|nr:hemin-degrading factor [Burkholderiaceae bacterium]